MRSTLCIFDLLDFFLQWLPAIILEIVKQVEKIYTGITLNFIIIDSERFNVCQTSFILLTRQVEEEV